MRDSFPGIIRIIGSAVLRLIYGKSYEERWFSDYDSGVKVVESLLSLGSVLWLCIVFYLLFCPIEPGTQHVVVYSIGYPAALSVWFIVVHLRAK